MLSGTKHTLSKGNQEDEPLKKKLETDPTKSPSAVAEVVVPQQAELTFDAQLVARGEAFLVRHISENHGNIIYIDVPEEFRLFIAVKIKDAVKDNNMMAQIFYELSDADQIKFLSILDKNRKDEVLRIYNEMLASRPQAIVDDQSLLSFIRSSPFNQRLSIIKSNLQFIHFESDYELARYFELLSKKDKCEFADIFKDKIKNIGTLKCFLRNLQNTNYNLLNLITPNALNQEQYFPLSVSDFARILEYFSPNQFVALRGKIEFKLKELIKTSSDLVKVLYPISSRFYVEFALDYNHVIKDSNDLILVADLLGNCPDSMLFINKNSDKIKDYATLKRLLLVHMPAGIKTANFIMQFKHLITDNYQIQEVMYWLGRLEGNKFFNEYTKVKSKDLKDSKSNASTCDDGFSTYVELLSLEKINSEQLSLAPYWPWGNPNKPVRFAEDNVLPSSPLLSQLNKLLLNKLIKYFIEKYKFSKNDDYISNTLPKERLLLAIAKEIYLLFIEYKKIIPEHLMKCNEQPETFGDAAMMFTQAAQLLALQDMNELQTAVKEQVSVAKAQGHHSYSMERMDLVGPVAYYSDLACECFRFGKENFDVTPHSSGLPKSGTYGLPGINSKQHCLVLDSLRNYWINFNNYKANILSQVHKILDGHVIRNDDIKAVGDVYDADGYQLARNNSFYDLMENGFLCRDRGYETYIFEALTVTERDGLIAKIKNNLPKVADNLLLQLDHFHQLLSDYLKKQDGKSRYIVEEEVKKGIWSYVPAYFCNILSLEKTYIEKNQMALTQGEIEKRLLYCRNLDKKLKEIKVLASKARCIQDDMRRCIPDDLDHKLSGLIDFLEKLKVKSSPQALSPSTMLAAMNFETNKEPAAVGFFAMQKDSKQDSGIAGVVNMSSLKR